MPNLFTAKVGALINRASSTAADDSQRQFPSSSANAAAAFRRNNARSGSHAVSDFSQAQALNQRHIISSTTQVVCRAAWGRQCRVNGVSQGYQAQCRPRRTWTSKLRIVVGDRFGNDRQSVAQRPVRGTECRREQNQTAQLEPLVRHDHNARFAVHARAKQNQYSRRTAHFRILSSAAPVRRNASRPKSPVHQSASKMLPISQHQVRLMMKVFVDMIAQPESAGESHDAAIVAAHQKSGVDSARATPHSASRGDVHKCMLPRQTMAGLLPQNQRHVDGLLSLSVPPSSMLPAQRRDDYLFVTCRRRAAISDAESWRTRHISPPVAKTISARRR